MKKKKWFVATLLAVSVLSLAACGKDEANDVKVPLEETPAQETPVAVLPVEDVNKIDETKTNPSETSVEEEAKTILTSTGTYVGNVDATHVKIQIGDSTAVYELINETKGVFDGVKANASITFDYYEGDEGELVLVSLLLNEAKEETPSNNNGTTASADVKKDEWVFVGMIDGHSSEFKKGSSYIVAQHDNALFGTINNLGDDETVSVEYTVSGSTYTLKSITKK